MRRLSRLRDPIQCKYPGTTFPHLTTTCIRYRGSPRHQQYTPSPIPQMRNTRHPLKQRRLRISTPLSLKPTPFTHSRDRAYGSTEYGSNYCSILFRRPLLFVRTSIPLRRPNRFLSRNGYPRLDGVNALINPRRLARPRTRTLYTSCLHVTLPLPFVAIWVLGFASSFACYKLLFTLSFFFRSVAIIALSA